MALNARGFALLLLNDWDGALQDLDKAILLNPNYGNAYRNRAVVRKAVGDAAGAAADVKRSERLAH